MEVECSEESSVAAICQWRDDKAGRVAEILVTVSKLGVDHAGDEILLLPVVAELTQPLEIIFSVNLCSKIKASMTKF